MRIGVLFAITALFVGVAGCGSVNSLGDLVGNTKVSVKLKNGEKIEGTVLQSGEGNSTVAITYGTISVSTGDVQSVESQAPAPAMTQGNGRLTKWDRCLQVLVANRPKATEVAPVAATVVDKGEFRNVPYQSHRSGDVEFNVYGDPDDPACLEIGIYQKSPSMEARKECLRTMLAMLNDPKDRETLKSESLDEGKVDRAGLTFEVTPSTAEDAYGGWWISIYDAKLVEQQRATDKELPQITIERREIVLKRPDDKADKKADKKQSDVLRWTVKEVKAARPDASGPDQGRVYLRGVHRKDGKWVALTTP
jgi:hypothetical protein